MIWMTNGTGDAAVRANRADRRVSRCLALLLFAAMPSSAAAATLRPMTTLDAPVVRLSDLFDDAGPLASQVLGPAPPPGGRIVVPARQLAGIARMFGVAWHPATPADTAVLERPGRLLPREVVLAALRPALDGVGAPADSDIVLPGFDAPMIPLRSQPTASVVQLDYDGAAGRFSAALVVTAEGMAPMQLRLSGRVVEMADIPVPVQRLAAGSVLRSADLTTARMPVGTLHGDVARDAARVVGMILRRAVNAREPLQMGDLAAPGTVEKGAHVMLEVAIGGLTATMQGVALDTAAPGERVEVLNPVSHMVVEGVLLPSGVVRVAPGSLPVPANPQTLAQATALR